MKVINFCGILYDVRAKRDGGWRMQIDGGADSFEELVQILRFFKDNQINVAMALVPYREGQKLTMDSSTPDSTTPKHYEQTSTSDQDSAPSESTHLDSSQRTAQRSQKEMDDQ